MSHSPERPTRLHHTAYVVKDLERTRRFYEEVIGLPLIATYVEHGNFTGKVSKYCHCFFGIEDGGALAFFQFDDPGEAEIFAVRNFSPFNHVALKTSAANQEAIGARAKEAGHGAGKLDHGYCTSLYVTDPDGLNLEFTVDSDKVDPTAINFTHPHQELARFLAGDTTPNNPLRSH